MDVCIGGDYNVNLFFPAKVYKRRYQIPIKRKTIHRRLHHLISKPIDIDPNRISGWLIYADNKRFEFHNGITSILFNLNEVKQVKGSRIVLSH